MVFAKLSQQYMVGNNGRDKSGPYFTGNELPIYYGNRISLL